MGAAGFAFWIVGRFFEADDPGAWVFAFGAAAHLSAAAGVMDKDDQDMFAAQAQEPWEDFFPVDGFVFVDAADQSGEVIEDKDGEILFFAQGNDGVLEAIIGEVHDAPGTFEEDLVIDVGEVWGWFAQDFIAPLDIGWWHFAVDVEDVMLVVDLPWADIGAGGQSVSDEHTQPGFTQAA